MQPDTMYFAFPSGHFHKDLPAALNPGLALVRYALKEFAQANGARHREVQFEWHDENWNAYPWNGRPLFLGPFDDEALTCPTPHDFVGSGLWLVPLADRAWIRYFAGRVRPSDCNVYYRLRDHWPKQLLLVEELKPDTWLSEYLLHNVKVPDNRYSKHWIHGLTEGQTLHRYRAELLERA